MSDKKPDEKPDKEDPNQEWISYVNPQTGERERVTLEAYKLLGI